MNKSPVLLFKFCLSWVVRLLVCMYQKDQSLVDIQNTVIHHSVSVQHSGNYPTIDIVAKRLKRVTSLLY